MIRWRRCNSVSLSVRKFRLLRASGGAVLFIAMAFLLILGVLANGSVVAYLTCLNHDSAVCTSQSVALDSAIGLNESDQIGRMNNLVAQARAGVYLSRQQYEQVQEQRFYALEPLARHLLEDARWGAQLVEQERQQLVAVKTEELQKSALAYNSASEGAEITRLEVGTADSDWCNVPDYESDQPHWFDVTNKNCDAKTGCFRANRDVRLPGDDSDLVFRFSAVPAPKGNQAIRAGLITGASFNPLALLLENGKAAESASTKCMPCAVRVTMLTHSANVQTGRALTTAAVAITNGAQPMP